MKLSLQPFTLGTHSWCYEEKGGLLIIHEDTTEKGSFVQHIRIKIPLKKIKGYLKRRNSPNQPKT